MMVFLQSIYPSQNDVSSGAFSHHNHPHPLLSTSEAFPAPSEDWWGTSKAGDFREGTPHQSSPGASPAPYPLSSFFLKNNSPRNALINFQHSYEKFGFAKRCFCKTAISAEWINIVLRGTTVSSCGVRGWEFNSSCTSCE